MKRTIVVVVVLVLFSGLVLAEPATMDAADQSAARPEGVAKGHQPQAVLSNRPPAWAQSMTVEGVPNLHKITDTLYRSAQPTAKGIENLKAMGIKSVINLRTFHSDRDEIGKTGIQQDHINMTAWHPDYEDAVRFLKVATDSIRQPVLFHCQHGADRTGTMCALYRMAVQGWTKEEALLEMTMGGYGFHEVWVNLPKWIQRLDIEKLKKDAGIK